MYIHVYIYVHIYMFIYVHTHTHTHTHIHTYTYIHIYTYIYTYIQVCEFQHKCFKRDQLHLLQQIRRKQAVERADGGRGKAQQQPDETVLRELNDMRMRQSQFEAKLLSIDQNQEREKQQIFQAVEFCYQRQVTKLY